MLTNYIVKKDVVLFGIGHLARHIGLAKMDAQRWSRQPGGERLAALRERDAETLKNWLKNVQP